MEYVIGIGSLIITAMGIWIAFLTYKHAAGWKTPLVERVAWHTWEFQIEFELTVRNQAPETIRVDSVTVVKPKGALILTDGHHKLATQELGQEIRPLGTPSFGTIVPGTADYHQFHVTVVPPARWASGRIDLEVRVSSLTGRVKGEKIPVSVVMPVTTFAVADRHSADPSKPWRL